MLRRGFATLLSLLAIAGLLRLILPSVLDTPDARAPGVASQLDHLKTRLTDGSAREAQALFPEGEFFTFILYGLARVDEVARGGDPAGLAEARRALDLATAPAVRERFGADQPLPYGIFYAGWTNWLRGALLQQQEPRDPELLAEFTEQARAIAAAFVAAPSPYLTSYPGQAWPCDSVVGVASLALYRELTGEVSVTAVVDRWLAASRDHLDPATGLLPHRADPETGRPLEGARATSLTVALVFLPDVDPGFAAEAYRRFRDTFLITPLGIPAVREFPRGTSGAGDVDSGPLIGGVSLSATVVALGAAQNNGDRALAAEIGTAGELIGLPLDLPGGKRYAAGLLPIGDTFVAWAKGVRPLVADPVPEVESAVGPASRTIWVIALLLLALVGWLPELRRRPEGSGSGAGHVS
ncbi:hypothetical protein [Microlunatus parietis]|uniref:Uncharacterized protein n=1 Tax=Microlunatus parietis TaxID=682979 RepID=A0A7Y9IA78_9ACTN|nr:hypothetical protein [Microlunatus parietis]NYE73158.1 hypothetical protein [Microlunatus parietis]